MKTPTKRELIDLADARIEDAKVLQAAGRYDAAYYLAGYAVECLLKAVIAQRTQKEQFPDLELARSSWKHDVVELLTPAELRNALKKEKASNSKFEKYWDVVIEWSETYRYSLNGPAWAPKAQDLIEAITDSTDGVGQWLKKNL